MSADHDVLVIGGGGAGLRAAIAIAETEPASARRDRLQGLPDAQPHRLGRGRRRRGRSPDDDSLDEHAYDTVSGQRLAVRPGRGRGLRGGGAPRAAAAGALGLPVEPAAGRPHRRARVRRHEEDAHVVRRRQDRLPHAAHAVPDLAEVRRRSTRYDEWFVTQLLVDDGRVQGVVAIELATGRIEAITAKAVILSTGGCGRVFPFTTNANINTGDGMALAYRAGAPLKDMEFVQYHPTGLPFTGILITEAARAEGGWLLNKDGYRYLQDYDLGTPDARRRCCAAWSSGPRDRLSQAFVHEEEKGRTIDTPVRPRRPPRPAAPGREADRHQAPVRARAVPEVREHRPGPRARPGAAGGALHDGRRPHRHRRRDAARGPVRRGRGRLREHQRRQPAGLELAARVPGVRRPRGPGGRRVCRRGARPRRPRVTRRHATRSAASRASCRDTERRP